MCVPHPLDTSANHAFDQIVECVQRAAEQHSYVLDRYYFPWRERTSPHDVLPVPSPPEKESKRVASETPPVATHKPGMLLLRSTARCTTDFPPILCVLLVPRGPNLGS